MPYKLKPKTMYMMPTHFGPMSGPRQGPGGEMGAFSVDQRKTRAYAVSFLTEQEQLEALLPPGFEAVGAPVVTVTHTHMTEIDWLAGRGYSTLGVTFQARYNGSRDRATGPLLLVLWENLTDPILTGREQLGFSKIYCELPEPVIHGGETQCTASWLGFRFMDMRLTNMAEVDAPAGAAAAENSDGGELQGTLHYKYVPKTGEWGEADAEYAVLSPLNAPVSEPKRWQGEGSVRFHRARWEDLPTQHMIVNALQELEVKECRGATITHSVGGRDLIDQRILR
ncbi:MAG: acetoacetate decarboxylase family protein [Chloroflexota bacterium]|nr:acetoacetate decarboxylase family protein [Chloroflexota bacterium]MDE2920662.1 acetoacetate decarboxylase family protein [Chloroflexota bacterium]